VLSAFHLIEYIPMPWLYLAFAGLFEIGFAVSMKFTEGFTKIGPSIFTALFAIVSFTCLSQAIKSIPIGTAYAIWTGTGAVGVAIIGMIYFKEPREFARVLFIILIATGMVGLKFVSPSE
jgi:quaternary ammonium compound-resistance protein SugE